MWIEARISLFDLITCISDTVDLVSPEVHNHHLQVAYIATALAGEMELSPERQRRLLIAGMVHDIGMFSMRERIDALQFELDAPHLHSKTGAVLLKEFPAFDDIAQIVKYHHVPWADGAGVSFEGEEVPADSHLIHLADRIAISTNPGESLVPQAKRVRERISGKGNRLFVPSAIDAFQSLSHKDYFWRDLASGSIGSLLRERILLDTLELSMEGLADLAGFFRRLIDFRSRFTATHSSGVASAAAALASLAGFSENECRRIEIAGSFHDLGKLGIPREIIQKPGPLDEHEYDVMRGHVYYTYRILQRLPALETIRVWGGLHQEYLDGTGYPFRLTAPDLPLGARIVAVADVSTALLEDRPYRAGMSPEEALGILQKLANANKLDPFVVGLLSRNLDQVNAIRTASQRAAVLEYESFRQNAGVA